MGKVDTLKEYLLILQFPHSKLFMCNLIPGVNTWAHFSMSLPTTFVANFRQPSLSRVPTSQPFLHWLSIAICEGTNNIPFASRLYRGVSAYFSHPFFSLLASLTCTVFFPLFRLELFLYCSLCCSSVNHFSLNKVGCIGSGCA